MLTTRDEWTDKPGAIGDDVIDAIRKQFNIGWWGVSLRLYGREDMNKAAYKVLEEAMGDIKPDADQADQLGARASRWNTPAGPARR